MIGLVTAAAGVAALWVGRRWMARRTEESCARRLPVGPAGVIVGADAITLDGDRDRAVLLVHGCGDTPQTLRYLAEHLHGQGYTVRVPLLPGHGRTLREFAAVGAEEWIDSIRGELAEMRERHARVGLVGLSMGGALASIIAADTPDLPVLVLLSPYVAMPEWLDRLALAHRVLTPFVPYVYGRGDESVYDRSEHARSLAYGYFTPRSLAELRRVVYRARAALPRIAAPTLVIQSREDNRIPAAAAASAFALLGAAEKRMEWVTDGRHVITVDYCRPTVLARTASWLGAHLGAPPPSLRAG